LLKLYLEARVVQWYSNQDMGLKSEEFGFSSWQWQEIFLSFKVFNLPLGLPSLLSRRYWELLHGGKAADA
jgi:hypothetical protein